MNHTRQRVTARIYRDENGALHQEYIVGGVAYPSVDALPTELEGMQ